MVLLVLLASAGLEDGLGVFVCDMGFLLILKLHHLLSIEAEDRGSLQEHCCGTDLWSANPSICRMFDAARDGGRGKTATYGAAM